jgi:endonuclease-8
VPEGDTILWAATRMRPVLEGQVVEVMHVHRRFGMDRWEQRLGGHTVTRVETHGKHLLIGFDHGVLLHSHLRMTGAWDVRPVDGRWMRSPNRAWLVLRAGESEVVQYDGSMLELITDGRRRFDQRLSVLGPDVLAPEFDELRYLSRLRATDQRMTIGEALLNQRILAGIGNIWKAEGCWEAGVDPWRQIGSLHDEEAARIVTLVRPRMLESGTQGPRSSTQLFVYRHTGRPCPRCGTPIASSSQRDDQNRTTYWCPGCQR